MSGRLRPPLDAVAARAGCWSGRSSGGRAALAGRPHGESSRADAGVADYDQRAGGEVLSDLLEVREDDCGEGAGAFAGAAEQDDTRR